LDINMPVFIFEGEKKALAFYRWCREREFAALVIAISGVWCWKGTVGKESDAHGNRVDVKGPLPDFDRIEFGSRTVYVSFDSNVHTNEKVRAAETGLARFLAGREANVMLARLPKNCGVNGIDDYLGKIASKDGLEAALAAGDRLLKDAIPFKAPKETPSEKLLTLTGELELFHTPDGDAYAVIDLGDHIENHRVMGSDFREYVTLQYFNAERKAPSKAAMDACMATIASQAKYEGSEHEVSIRVAEHDGYLYIDLCNDLWQVVEIRPDGYSVLDSGESPVRFRRTATMRALPVPQGEGSLEPIKRLFGIDRDTCDGAREQVSHAGEPIHTSDNGNGDTCDTSLSFFKGERIERETNYALLGGFMLNALRPGHPYPILNLNGEQGTGKSTAAEKVRAVIDPCVPAHRSLPRKEDDLIIGAANGHLQSFDNVSFIDPAMSDALCRLSTGGGTAKRRLYSDAEEQIFDVRRPIILNGIGCFVNRPDLADRCLDVKLPVITPAQRRPEHEINAEFEAERPEIFSALVTAACVALRNLPETRVPNCPRMADFANWATAGETALGLEPGGFMRAYRRNRDNSHSNILEGSVLAEVLLEYCEANLKDGRFSRDKILLKQLLEELRVQADIDEKNLRSKKRSFPSSPQKLRTYILRLNPDLRAIGLEITFLLKNRQGARIALSYDPNKVSQASQASQANDGGILKRDTSRDTHEPAKVQVSRERSRCACGEMGEIGRDCINCGEPVEDFAAKAAS
jgi:hypothetical protein